MRYIVGIDLGTTNCCVAYVDLHQPGQLIQNFRIPQLTKAGTVESKPTLPSFCYLYSDKEFSSEEIKLPWKDHLKYLVGFFAKEAGSKTPTKLVQSAKSWLCHSGVDRKARLLPFEAADESKKISPLEASSRYLNHIREAWNHEMASQDIDAELEHQEIILTVPASFDEIARALTVEAAKQIGLTKLTLLEEPQAAFYSWIHSHDKSWQTFFNDQDLILVCDIGGGTTDFSLIEVVQKDGDLTFQRMSVGNHLLLGGDNMDRALAHLIEQRLQEHVDASGVWFQILQEARKAKEYLLNQEGAFYQVSIQGRGSKVIEGSLSLTLSKNDVNALLTKGFFEIYPWNDAVKLKKTEGMRAMGLPYEDDPSITKQMAFFLKNATNLEHVLRGPKFILFNGGALKPALFQEALVNSLNLWFPENAVQTLKTVSLDLAVARGAAYYGKVKLGKGIKIGGGTPRSYYLGITLDNQEKALNVVPRGAEEGHLFRTEKVFLLKANTPVAFRMYSSHVRLYDKPGSLSEIDPKEMQALPPIHTLLIYGKKHDQEEIPVQVEISLTTVGTLEIWLQSIKTNHRWKLEFQINRNQGQIGEKEQRLDRTFDQEYLNRAAELLQESYSENGSSHPSLLVEKLEVALDLPKNQWPLSVLRGLADILLQKAPARKLSIDLESRWWNLIGFMMRPGYGYPLDEFRIKQIWKIILGDLKTFKNKETYLQALICFRRLAGGLNKGQQTFIAADLISNYFKKEGKANPYLESEKTRLLGSLEHLDLSTKIKLGDFLLKQCLDGKASKADIWALARIGARQMMYGALPNVIPREVVEKWLDQILQSTKISPDQQKLLVRSLARKTDHRELNFSEPFIRQILDKLNDDEFYETLEKAQPLSLAEQEHLFGDDLPIGLKLFHENEEI